MEIDPTNATVVGPVGYCIYCGARPPATVMSDEHVVPRGLGGGLIIKRGSCEDCRKTTQKFEEACLRGSFLPFRVKAGLQKPTNKDRPKKLRLKIGKDLTDAMVDVEDFPHWLHMPRFSEPGIFSQRDHGLDTIELRMETFANPSKLDDYAGKHGGQISEDVEFQLKPFCQMLAKIAHGFSLFTHGPENFRPILTDLIRGLDDDIGYYIGERPLPIGIPENLFANSAHKFFSSIMPLNGVNFICTYVQLLATYSAPTYCVVTGELTPTAGWLSRHGLRKEGASLVAAQQ
jgi:hypothetical protein